MRAGDASDRGEPQSRAVGIRTEEGAEDSRQVFFGYAPAIVSDFDDRFPAGPILIVAFAQSHDYGPMAVYGLDGVGEQPMQGVFDLRGVNVHDDRRLIRDEFDLNLPAAR